MFTRTKKVSLEKDLFESDVEKRKESDCEENESLKNDEIAPQKAEEIIESLKNDKIASQKATVNNLPDAFAAAPTPAVDNLLSLDIAPSKSLLVEEDEKTPEKVYKPSLITSELINGEKVFTMGEKKFIVHNEKVVYL
jgi:hypothetical protein